MKENALKIGMICGLSVYSPTDKELLLAVKKIIIRQNIIDCHSF